MDRQASDWVCVAAVATAHGIRGALKLRCFTERPEDADTIDPYSVATLRFGLAYERAVLDWFDALPELIRGRRGAG